MFEPELGRCYALGILQFSLRIHIIVTMAANLVLPRLPYITVTLYTPDLLQLPGLMQYLHA